MSRPFENPKRYVTTHNAEGKAVFSGDLAESLPAYEIPGMSFYEAYTTFEAPVNMNDETDIKAIQSNKENEVNISFPKPGAVILRYCDWPPGGSSPLHRHETMDFGIVVRGEMEAIMDSGETRLLKAGDLLVQRNTLHAWRNPSPTQYARVIFVIQGSSPVNIGGKVMHQDLTRFGKPTEDA
ncbi:cupin domain protein [Lasiosphaeria hispida]|uniref:Cupin domain protein n=1 Tax=Lasiosphaeria hispida TaxID=260671 RepID=A0AAJ0HL24_9PEZI|nr:cupin domain protein [Lasiosphaeria hispida]